MKSITEEAPLTRTVKVTVDVTMEPTPSSELNGLAGSFTAAEGVLRVSDDLTEEHAQTMMEAICRETVLSAFGFEGDGESSAGLLNLEWLIDEAGTLTMALAD
jgi:hypothetical protein